MSILPLSDFTPKPLSDSTPKTPQFPEVAISNLIDKFIKFQSIASKEVDTSNLGDWFITFRPNVSNEATVETEGVEEIQNPKRQKLSQKTTLVTYLETNELDCGSKFKIACQILDKYADLSAAVNGITGNISTNQLQLFIPSNLDLHVDEDGKISVVFQKLKKSIISKENMEIFRDYCEKEFSIYYDPHKSMAGKLLLGKLLRIIFKEELNLPRPPFEIKEMITYLTQKTSKFTTALERFNNMYDKFFNKSQKT